MKTPLKNLSRLCIHTVTTKPWSLEEAVPAYAKAGVKGITLWRDVLAGREVATSRQLIADHGMSIVSLCRGGFFPSSSAEKRRTAIDDNRAMIEEARAVGAPLIVLVCGAEPGLPLTEAREHIRAGIEAIVPEAEAAGVKLGIEPLHPMYADDRSAINTLGQANDMVEQIGSPMVGVAVDVYHLWWDPALEQEIARCGDLGALFAYHVCDWMTPTADILLDRGLMGEGCIPLKQIRGWVEATGFKGFNEVEIFSKRHWEKDQAVFLQEIVEAYQQHV